MWERFPNVLSAALRFLLQVIKKILPIFMDGYSKQTHKEAKLKTASQNLSYEKKLIQMRLLVSVRFGLFVKTLMSKQKTECVSSSLIY